MDISVLFMSIINIKILFRQDCLGVEHRQVKNTQKASVVYEYWNKTYILSVLWDILDRNLVGSQLQYGLLGPLLKGAKASPKV